MARYSGSTYVSVAVVDAAEVAAFVELRKLAAARLGGEDGLRVVNVNRVGEDLAGTFVREWDDELKGIN
jgi:hypothetical protein